MSNLPLILVVASQMKFSYKEEKASQSDLAKSHKTRVELGEKPYFKLYLYIFIANALASNQTQNHLYSCGCWV